MPTKLIEVALPLNVINKACADEKARKVGKPTQVHHYWARRPITACRAVLFSQLVDDPSAHPELFPTEAEQEHERQRLFDIIERLVDWEAIKNGKVLDEARAEIRRWYPDGTPPIIDPFCGGGSIPLEAQRLGLEVYASDLNPVAVLITKALTEIPFKFANRSPVHPDSGTTLHMSQSWLGASGLAEDVRYYGKWIRDEAEHRIGHLYPKAILPDGNRAPVLAMLWARTVTCPNPACRSNMPLVRSFWLAKKPGKETWVRPVVDSAIKQIQYEIGYGKEGPPIGGTVGRTGAVCLVCNSPVPLEYIRKEGQGRRLGMQLMAIVADGDRRRVYLAPTAEMEAAAEVDPPMDAPDTDLPEKALSFRVQAYGMTRHSDLFTARQLRVMCAFSDLTREVYGRILEDSDQDHAYADAVVTYLALAVSRLADWSNSLCRWESNAQVSQQLFNQQSVPMVWDFAEAYTLGDGNTGSFTAAITNVVRSLGQLVASVPARVAQKDAVAALTSCPPGWVLATDPPYYDNIGYADLSDLFYIWLRRSLATVHPDLFATVLTPKSAELVASPARFGGDQRSADQHFEAGLREVFRVVADHAGPSTPMSIFYAFKQSESGVDESRGNTIVSSGWEKMLEGLIGSSLAVTGTWPMRTEMSSRTIGQGTNALASAIVLVCRPRADTAGITDRRGFVQDLKTRLGHALRDLQSGGIAPVDLAQAAIGPGMAVFSSYAKVVEPDGDGMRVRTALALINQVLDEVSAEQEGEFDEETRWAIAWYAEHGLDEGSFGRADDLSRAKNVSVEGLVRAGLVKSGGGKVRLLERDELDADWDPTTDSHLTVWEVTQHLIRRLLDGGEASAAELLAKVGSLGDAARDLAYRLFLIAESKKWAKEAGPYNALAASWLEISRLAALEPDGQGSLFEGGTDGGQ